MTKGAEGKRSSHASDNFVHGVPVAIATPIEKGDDAFSTTTDDTFTSEEPIEFGTAKRGKGDSRRNPLVGRWTAIDLARGGDPGAPDEEVIEIGETAIAFVNGGGGFANGPYNLDESGSYTATQGGESIRFERDGERLKVTFAGGDYGDPVTIFYTKGATVPGITAVQVLCLALSLFVLVLLMAIYGVNLPRDIPLCLFPVGMIKYVTFVGQNEMTLMLTKDEIQETSDFDAKCKSEYGPNARVSDWSNDLLSLDTDQVNDMIAALDIAQTFNEKYYYVSNGGDKYFGDGDRAYFFENHGGNPPGNWLVHDQLGDITLGSWYGIMGQVLCTQEMTSGKSSGPVANGIPAAASTIEGRWTAVDLARGGDPGAPDKEVIEISETAITFVNGGGGFANGPYRLDGSGSYTATQGEESIKFERDGEQLKVTFAGGGYGDPVTVFYTTEVHLPMNDSPSLTTPGITKYVTFVGRNKMTLMLTTDEIQENSDFDAKCKSEYGPNARVADWSNDLLSLDSDQVNEMIAALDIAQSFNEKYYYVSNGGDKYFGGDSRAYFFENHGGNPPGNWLVHDQLGDITLGSWYGIMGQVLCIEE